MSRAVPASHYRNPFIDLRKTTPGADPPRGAHTQILDVLGVRLQQVDEGQGQSAVPRRAFCAVLGVPTCEVRCANAGVASCIEGSWQGSLVCPEKRTARNMPPQHATKAVVSRVLSTCVSKGHRTPGVSLDNGPQHGGRHSGRTHGPRTRRNLGALSGHGLRARSQSGMLGTHNRGTPWGNRLAHAGWSPLRPRQRACPHRGAPVGCIVVEIRALARCFVAGGRFWSACIECPPGVRAPRARRFRPSFVSGHPACSSPRGKRREASRPLLTPPPDPTLSVATSSRLARSTHPPPREARAPKDPSFAS